MDESNYIWNGMEPYSEEPGKGGRLLVREIPDKIRATKGGILLPETFKGTHKLFEILAVSRDCPSCFAKDMTILTGVYAGLEFDFAGDRVQLTATGDVLGIIHGAPDDGTVEVEEEEAGDAPEAP